MRGLAPWACGGRASPFERVAVPEVPLRAMPRERGAKCGVRLHSLGKRLSQEFELLRGDHGVRLRLDRDRLELGCR